MIAFPKTQSGVDPLTGAPSPVDPNHLKDLGLRLLNPQTPNPQQLSRKSSREIPQQLAANPVWGNDFAANA